ncbi:helix-turn-helix domain-containing protein [Mariprofundus micogutta]|nr:helix-turn-helix domain-containing protein [Mariprofundus micogutta]
MARLIDEELRTQIKALIDEGKDVNAIAEATGKTKATIYNYIRRNDWKLQKKEKPVVKKKPRGRPAKSHLDPYLAEITRRVQIGIPINTIAGQCDVSRQTLYTFFEKHNIDPNSFHPEDYKLPEIEAETVKEEKGKLEEVMTPQDETATKI